MGTRLAIALLLGACTQAPAPPGTTPGTEPTTGFGEPISTQQVLQGIQIGEGGDQLPCDANLAPVGDGSMDDRFSDLEGSWADLPYAYEGLTGDATLTVVLDGVWELTWTELDGSVSTFDCEAEPTAHVGALWLDIDGDSLQLTVPVFGRTIDQPVADFVGEAPSEELGLGEGAPYGLWGRVDGGELVVDVYTDLLYGTPVGTFGEGG